MRADAGTANRWPLYTSQVALVRGHGLLYTSI